MRRDPALSEPRQRRGYMCSMLVRQRIYPLMSPLSEASDCLPRRLRCRRSFIVAKISDANYEHLIGNAGRIMLIATARASGAHKRGYASRADALLSTPAANSAGGGDTRLEAEPGAAHGL